MWGSRSRRSSASSSAGSGGAAGTPRQVAVRVGHWSVPPSPYRGPAAGALGRVSVSPARCSVPRVWCWCGGPGWRRGRPRRTGRGPRRGPEPSRPRSGRQLGQLDGVGHLDLHPACRRRRPRPARTGRRHRGRGTRPRRGRRLVVAGPAARPVGPGSGVVDAGECPGWPAGDGRPRPARRRRRGR